MFFLRVHFVHFLHYPQANIVQMDYIEIEKLVSFTKTHKMKSEWQTLKGLPARDLLVEIRDYDVNPAIKEMQSNFQIVDANNEIEKRLERDYNIYLNELEENILQYGEFEQTVFGWKVNRLKRQLRIKTLSSNLITNEAPINETDHLNENPFEKIFSNDLAYTIFLKMYSIYKDEEKINNSNYSFLYYSLNDDELLTCNGSEFIDFVTTEFDVIDFTKLDSRFKENKHRRKLYNAIKDTISKLAR